MIIDFHIASIDWNNDLEITLNIKRIAECVSNHKTLFNYVCSKIEEYLKYYKCPWQPEQILTVSEKIFKDKCHDKIFISFLPHLY